MPKGSRRGPVLRLFDDFVHTDFSPAGHQESSFAFLNRAAGPLWERVRGLLEQWFSDYSADAAADLVGRFRSADLPQHLSAWWELYLFTLYRRLGYSVQVHPTVPGGTTRPDFLVVRGDEQFYVEAAVVFSGIVDERRDETREAWIYDLVNTVTDPNFHVGLELDHAGRQRPKASEITRPLQQWLSSLDPDEVEAAHDAGQDLPELYLQARDWELVFTAFPIKREHRGQPGRLLGVYPALGGTINDEEKARKALRRKAGHYGLPDKPLVVALLCMSPFMDDSTIEQVLFGSLAVQYYINQPGSDVKWVRQRNGVWMRGTQPRYTRVSAVLTATELTPWRVTSQLPRLWINPWATKPPTVTEPFATTTADDDGRITSTETDAQTHTILGLPHDWPGPQHPTDEDEHE